MQQLNGHETINTKLGLNTSQPNIDVEIENGNLSPIYSRVFKSLNNNKNDSKLQAKQEEDDDELTYKNDDHTDIKSIEEEDDDDQIENLDDDILNEDDENKLNFNSYQTNNYMYLLNAEEECNQTFESQSNQDDTNNINKLDDHYFMPKY
jgi:hypothetical protein